MKRQISDKGHQPIVVLTGSGRDTIFTTMIKRPLSIIILATVLILAGVSTPSAEKSNDTKKEKTAQNAIQPETDTTTPSPVADDSPIDPGIQKKAVPKQKPGVKGQNKEQRKKESQEKSSSRD